MILEINNGVSYILAVEWMSFVELELDTESAGGIGKRCGAYLQGEWVYLKWPKEWSWTDILRYMTYLEIFLIAIFVWFDRFQLKDMYYIYHGSYELTY